jgi:RNA polymerase sigma-54 factor
MADAVRDALFPPGSGERARPEPDRASGPARDDGSAAEPRERERAEGSARREERERRREPDRQRLVAAVDRLLALEPRPGRACATREALAHRLGVQLQEEALLPEVRLAAEAIVASLDHDGYLPVPLAEVAEKTPLPGFDRALALVQTFDPIGVGARGLRECLLIQLRAQKTPDAVATEILETHFDRLQRCRYAEIARALKLEVSRVEEAVEAIAALEPKPGRRFAAVETRYVVPDVYVHKIDGEYKVVLNDEGIPRLRINSYYRTLLARSPGDDGRRYVEDKVRSAMWLIKSVHQRQRTLHRVTDSIVRFQKEFLDHGLPHLKPLSLRDVADDIKMHESTVSRVTTSKYVQTPQGLYELKFFFHSGIATGEGDVVSSISVKKTIRDLVAGESPQKPLSDQEITHSLRQSGLNIARRTVAKYRGSSASSRRISDGWRPGGGVRRRETRRRASRAGRRAGERLARVKPGG